MKTNITLILILLSIAGTKSYSQEIGVLAGVTDENKVLVRWFSSEVFNAEGVNLYRKEIHQDDWVRLNSAPIRKMERVSPQSKDTTLAIYSALIYSTPDTGDEETAKLALLAKCLSDKNFAHAFGMQYEDADVIPGETYEYKVAKLEAGEEEYSGVSEKITIQAYNPPSAPADFSGEAKDGLVTLKWKKNEEAFFAYNIYRGDSPDAPKKLVNSNPVFIFEFQDSSGNYSTLDFFYKDTALTNGRTYYYELTGVDYLGMESKRSASLLLTPKDLTPPPAPYNLNNLTNNNNVIITWKAEIVNDLKGYDLYRSADYKGPFTKVNTTIIPAKDTSYSDIIKDPVERYYYYLTAQDNSDNQSSSVIMAVVLPDQTAPARPEGLKAVGDTGFVVLSWKKGSEKDLLGYFVYRSVSGVEDEFVLLNPRPVSADTYTDTLKKEATNSFIYRIMAVDRKYNQSEYSSVVSIKLKDAVPPSAPVLLSITIDDNTAELKWTQTEFVDASGSYIFRSIDGKAVRLNEKSIPASVSTYFDTLIEAGVYVYYLTTVDSSGNTSQRSNLLSIEYSGKTALAQVEDLKAEITADKTAVKLSWRSIDSKNLLGYIVFSDDKETSDFGNAISPLQMETSFIDSTGSNGNLFYCVKAFDSLGNISVSKIIKP